MKISPIPITRTHSTLQQNTALFNRTRCYSTSHTLLNSNAISLNILHALLLFLLLCRNVAAVWIKQISRKPNEQVIQSELKVKYVHLNQCKVFDKKKNWFPQSFHLRFSLNAAIFSIAKEWVGRNLEFLLENFSLANCESHKNDMKLNS